MNTLDLATISHPFLQSIPTEYRELLLKNARLAEYQAGDVLFREGEPANRFFLIKSGRVAVEAGIDSPNRVQTLSSGDVLGWSWLFPPFGWNFSAQALDQTQCIVLDGGHLLVTAEENPKFGYDLMRRITQILIARLQATRKKMMEVSAPK